MADDSALSPARRNFNLQAFRELKQEDFDSSQESELLNNPVNIAVINKDTYSKQSLDDGVIKRIYKSPFHDNQNSTRTLPRRPSEQQNNERYFYPSNTIVASNGHVYHVEPFMLPPPQQISQVIRDLTDRTEKSKTDFFSDNRSSKGSLSRRNNEFKFDSSTSLLRPASMRSSSSRSLDDGSYKSSYLRATQSSRDVLHMVEDENDDDGIIII